MPGDVPREANPRKWQLFKSLHHFGVPLHLHDGLADYVTKGTPTGSFLRACLENDFVDAMCHAGADIGRDDLVAIAKWIYNEAPGKCWGSRGVVKTWRGE